MKKLDSLRSHLTDSIIDLRRNPDRLLTFIDAGGVRSTTAHGLSYEYSYKANLIITDFTGSVDAIMIALLSWLRRNQHEALANFDSGTEAVQFEADILDNERFDIAITLPLTERVIVRAAGEHAYTAEHAGEPELTEHIEASHFIVRDAHGNVLVEWDSADPLGTDIESPHPGPTGPKPNWFDGLTTGNAIYSNDDG